MIRTANGEDITFKDYGKYLTISYSELTSLKQAIILLLSQTSFSIQVENKYKLKSH